MPDPSVYYATQIDWEKLRRYATRVARQTEVPARAPVVRTERVEKDVPVEKRTSGFLGIGAKTRIVMERHKVDDQIEVVGPHWLLSRSFWSGGDKYTTNSLGRKVRVDEKNEETDSVILVQDGSLLRLHRKQGWVFNYGGTQDGLVAVWDDYDLKPLSEHDVTSFDFRKGQNGAQPVLVRHAKGVGINLALKDLLEGRTPRGVRS
ncbi:hypothetical protein ACH9EU_08645 [Kocuria sp. M1R5S2]|uniref:hypothetical protein n=1 Tax=Kocuria rhizosphaerae TaxID=3376285 RepID=UPI0037A16C0E